MEFVDFLPKSRDALLGGPHLVAKPPISLVQHKGPWTCNAGTITFPNCGADFFWREAETNLLGENRARGQADQIRGIRNYSSIVKIVNAPHQTTLLVMPDPKVLDMGIAD